MNDTVERGGGREGRLRQTVLSVGFGDAGSRRERHFGSKDCGGDAVGIVAMVS